MEIFALAAKKKLRFDTSKGHLTAEDLWDLPLTSQNGKPNLDDIAKGLYKVIKEGADISFVKPEKKNIVFDENQTKFNIVKFVIDFKLAEAEKAKSAKAVHEKNQRILEIIAKKDDDTLVLKSREELLAMIHSEENEE